MLVALFLATLVGLALGLFGGGGSLLSVAVLSLVLGMPARAAMSASLLIIGVTSVAALVAQSERGLVSVRTALTFGSVGMVGAFAGGRVAALIPEAVLLTGFIGVMFVTSLAMLGLKPALREADAQPAREEKLAYVVGVGGLALGLGVVTGVLGAGGGFLIVPALVLHAGMPIKRAMATSLVVIALQSFAGLLGHLGQASFDWAVVVPFTLMATLGSVVGGALGRRTSPQLLRRGFGALVLLVAVLVVLRELPQSP